MFTGPTTEEVEYSLYLSRHATGERHHLYKMEEFFPSVRRRAEYVLKEMQRGGGTLYCLHHEWSDSVEVWETHAGDHEPFAAPDRLVAHAYWTQRDSRLTLVGDFGDEEDSL